MSSHTEPEAYVELIGETGFVPATREVLKQVLQNAARLDEVEGQLSEVVALLGKRLDKLEKGK